MNVIPRTPYRPSVITDQNGETLMAFSGRFAGMVTRAFAPSDDDIRAMLLAIHKTTGTGIGHLATLLGTTPIAVSSWWRGRRSPSLAARRTVWIVFTLLHSPAILGDYGAWMHWKRDGIDPKMNVDALVGRKSFARLAHINHRRRSKVKGRSHGCLQQAAAAA